MEIKVETKNIGDEVFALIKGKIYRATIEKIGFKGLADNDTQYITMTYYVKLIFDDKIHNINVKDVIKADKVGTTLEAFVTDPEEFYS